MNPTMPAAQFVTPENRLADILGSRDAPLAQHLVDDADRKVATLGEAVRRHVHATLKQVFQHAGAVAELSAEEIAVLGRAALSIAEVAGAAGMDAIGEICRGVSIAISAAAPGEPLRMDVLKLHLDALALANNRASYDH